MKLLAHGCRLYGAEEGEVRVAGSWAARSVISTASGAKLISQAVNEYAPGVSPAVVNPGSEEVLYVVEGEGVCRIDGFAYPVRAGSGIFVPPGASCLFETSSGLRVVSACCPEDPARRVIDGGIEEKPGDGPRRTVHEDEREEIRAGEDRVFRYMVHTDVGCKQVTQFVGMIPPSKAPFHLHEYEEGIFILGGRGILHLHGPKSSTEFGAGDHIYLPQGTVHCLENPGPEPIRLLGVFHPSGSPGAAYEND